MNYLERMVDRTRSIGIFKYDTAEETAAKYAVTVVGKGSFGDASLLRLTEAYLRQFRHSGAVFDIKYAARLARLFLIHFATDKARNELGGEAADAEIVARVMGNDGDRFILWEGGDHTDPVDLGDICEERFGSKECGEQRDAAVRWSFGDGSAIVVRGGRWTVEDDRRLNEDWDEDWEGPRP